jgi:UDP-GlcNAc:undecaprenyl-phosphate/decaprenyl-phosphate GlcNAc-1-phosphate transferase
MSVLILAFTTSFVITFLAIPSIIAVAKSRKLFDLPNDRSAHTTPTPSLGGIGIFGGVICGIILWTPPAYFAQLQYTLAAFILLFLVGTRDDLAPVPPFKKMAMQVLAALILVYKANMTITDWWGILGVYELSIWAAAAFTLVAIVGIVNAYNLIDGINGLAGSIALIASFFFGSWFYLTGHIEWATVAIAMLGALTAFLKYNFTPARIFMGDTGSLLIGLTCSVMAIQFITFAKQLPTDHVCYFSSAPIIALSVMILPIYDTFRVFLRRMVHGKSPFHADKTHIHHLILAKGYTHMEATAILSTVSIALIALAVGLDNIGINRLLLVLMCTTILLNYCLLVLLPNRRQQEVPASSGAGE